MQAIPLILYSKPGCHLCEGLHEKLMQITDLSLELEIRDITTREDWFQAYQYEIPVLFWVKGAGEQGSRGAGEQGSPSTSSGTGGAGEQGEMVAIPRISPRASVGQVEKVLRQIVSNISPEVS